MLNLYITDFQVLFSAKEEFNNYLNISKPLFNIQYNPPFEHKTDLSKYISDNITVNNITVKIYIKECEFIIIKDSTTILSTTEPSLVKAFIEYYKSNFNSQFT